MEIYRRKSFVCVASLDSTSERIISDFSGETGEIATRDTPEKSTFVSDLVEFNRLSKNPPPAEKSHQTPSSEALSKRSTPDATAVETTGFGVGCEALEPRQARYSTSVAPESHVSAFDRAVEGESRPAANAAPTRKTRSRIKPPVIEVVYVPTKIDPYDQKVVYDIIANWILKGIEKEMKNKPPS